MQVRQLIALSGTIDGIKWPGIGETIDLAPHVCESLIANGFAEEVVVVGYLITRLRQLGLTSPRAVLASSVLRGVYHLYQGFGAGLGNVVMGLVFGYAWCRTGRLGPLVIAHGIIDSVAFVGYALLAGRIGWLR